MSEHGTSVAPAGLKRTPASFSLDPRHNSINFLRLALALTVVMSHVIQLGRFSSIPNAVNQNSLGQLAVYAFFGISGFLITGSAVRI